jgi:hypothetical protein
LPNKFIDQTPGGRSAAVNKYMCAGFDEISHPFDLTRQ